MKNPEKIFKMAFYGGASLCIISMSSLLIFGRILVLPVLLSLFLLGIALGIDLVEEYYKRNKAK
jgi:hypothetical protein